MMQGSCALPSSSSISYSAEKLAIAADVTFSGEMSRRSSVSRGYSNVGIMAM